MERKDAQKASTASQHLVCLMVLAFVTCVVKGAEAVPLTPAMFIFGDSLIDDGNNNYMPTVARANYLPYGIDLGIPTGRFCNGLTVVDYGASLLGLPLIPPYLSPTSKGSKILNGLNYASAAAGILDETGRHYGGRMSFSGQILLFEKTIRYQLPPLFETQEALSQYLTKSVFIINIGSNDYINNYLLPNIYATSRLYKGEAFADLLIATLTMQISLSSKLCSPGLDFADPNSFVLGFIDGLSVSLVSSTMPKLYTSSLISNLKDKLYRLGARKMLLVGIGPLGCIPSQLYMRSSTNSNGCVEWVNDLVSLFNDRLVYFSKTMNSTLVGSSFVYQNIFDVFSDMIKNPSKYGFTVSDQACCGNGRHGGALTCLPLQPSCSNRDEYIFWDSFHPTQAVNKIIADRCYSAFGTDCHPISVYQLAQI
ncbi:hypothetical protein Sjap_015346 [Stephania japonica]|uniref:GDSL esterase/lipase 7 n=1 Tax=Stephania japonica TaxID=461633 RepID=A0AAP0IIY8_9MAGN